VAGGAVAVSVRAPGLSGLHLFQLEASGVLYCEASQEIHLLNATAALIFALLADGQDEAGAAALLARDHGIGAARAARYVADTASLLREARRGAPARAPRADEVMPDTPWQMVAVARRQRYRFLGADFVVRYATDAQFARVHPVLAHLATDDAERAATLVDVGETQDGVVVWRDRTPFDRCATLAGLAPIVKSLVWVTAVGRRGFFLDIHAGVIGAQHGCVLLPGASGSGKSTLTALLAHAGYEFYSDEIALLDETLAVIPAPLPLCVKEAGIAALAHAYPQLRELPLHLRGDGKRVAYVTPPDDSMPAGDSSRPVAVVVFPRYVQEGGTSLAVVPKAAALKRLLDECVVVRALDAAKVAALVGWIAQVPCYSLEFDSGVHAARAVGSLLARPA